MKRRSSKQGFRFLCALASIAMMISQMHYTVHAETESTSNNAILINEVESDDATGANDWVEIINTATVDVDISHWFISDNKELERVGDGTAWALPEGTVLKAGAVLVLEQDIDFDFGLGKNDKVVLYDGSSQVMDSYAWTGHAVGTYSRVVGSTEFVDQQPTKGAANSVVEETPVLQGIMVINEINSAPDDWVEFTNAGNEVLDISGYEIRDNSDDHRWKFTDGTQLQPGDLLLVGADTVGLVYDQQSDTYSEGEFQAALGIGSGDAIRLYDKDGNLIDQYSWTQHASYDGNESLASYGRYPDGTGSFALMEETPGVKNSWYAPKIVINEVESNDDATDWIEVYNAGSTAVDISGWYMLDNDPVGHATDISPVAAGTILEPGAFYVFDQNIHFTFGLGKADQATIFNADGVVVAEYSWTAHANGVFARIPDGTGDFVEFAVSTKGKANIITNPVVISEVQSKDPDNGPDWIELANPTNAPLDISGIVIKDNDDAHEYVIPAGTLIPANGYIVFTEDDFGFGLGKNDRVRLFENGLLIGTTTWDGHTDPTWGLYPDASGTYYQSTLIATPGSANKFAGIPEIVAWDGNQDVITYDTESMFLEDSSGLDFYNGQLYAVDNGVGKFWILDVAEDGSLSFAEGFENGKRVRFQKDAANAAAAGPDSEGITVDGDNFVYIASERDNSAKGVNYNVILKVDPFADGTDLVALQEWDLTASLPQVSANMGIEAVEWVANENVEGKLFDQNTNAAFTASSYPDAVANGVFFVALEDNGHVYAYVLNEDGSVVQIADIDSKLGGAMALDFDTYENVLWVASDDGYGNKAAKITLTGEAATAIIHVAAPSGVDVTRNNEGFAIAEARFTKDGQRAVYRFADGFKSGSLTIGSLASDYSDSYEFTVQSLELKVGEKTKLELVQTAQSTRSLLAARAAAQFAWSSTDSSVITVDQEGNVEAIGVGSAEVVVTINGSQTIRLAVNVVANDAATPEAPVSPGNGDSAILPGLGAQESSNAVYAFMAFAGFALVVVSRSMRKKEQH